MNKLKMHTPSITQDNIARIRELFPNCVTEVREDVKMDKDSYTVKLMVDFDLLRQELSEAIVEGPQERYHLNWPGKRESLLIANAPIAKTLRPCREESVDFDTTKNLFIEGDNLDALKLLQETYLGKVKMIYIDPPYNTGNDFIYKDSFASDQITHQVASGERTEEGARLVANSEENGRFHSNWLTMIASRIRMAKNMLTQDGAIFVSCDEGEHPRLRLVMDEIFGQSNFVADMIWAAGRKNDSRLVSVSHEYIVCYARDVEYLSKKQITWRQRKKGLDEIYAQCERLKRQHRSDYKAMTREIKEWYRGLADGHAAKAHKHYCNIDSYGIYFAADISWPGGGGPKYEVLHPVTKKPVKTPSRGWMTSNPERMQEWIDDDRVHFGDDENAVPCIKSYLKDKELQTPYSVFYQDGRAASKRLRMLMDGDLFDFPKDELVLQEVIEMLTKDKDIVLDFFAGSSTTAHSVMLQNAADGENRRFIMVQFDEKTTDDSLAFKAGFKTIPEVSRERIRRAGKQILEGSCHDGWNKDTGFRVLKIDTSNMADVYYAPDTLNKGTLDLFIDNIKPDRTPEDLLFQVMLDWGVDLTLPITRQTIKDKEVFFVDNNALAACFDAHGGIDEAFVKELAKHQALRVVFRDAGYKDSAVKINVEQIFKLLSPTTEIKCI
ncbi:site-specific DNA-methyltransferase [Verminephrobacter eiseniae]|uniref:site-specific DNA-methyltransferase n=1 Tax=Verminephrobacter eiseniae TaxID=364317 RepID=UPI00223750AA|nr:site-specific DNA-methyltransferase [Verminephrobacter eiseniae]MCW5237804.1 site-specific DNA-methyltransferase [Verminephrobacter eiseniae]